MACQILTATVMEDVDLSLPAVIHLGFVAPISAKCQAVARLLTDFYGITVSVYTATFFHFFWSRQAFFIDRKATTSQVLRPSELDRYGALP